MKGERSVYERRLEDRIPAEISITLDTLDGERDFDKSAVVSEVSYQGATILASVPLPIGTHLELALEGYRVATAEVVDWNWDYTNNKARLGVRFIEKSLECEPLFI